MKGHGNEIEDRRVEQLFADLERQTSPPDEQKLRTLARSAAAEPRPPGIRSRRWAHPLRWVVAAVAVALLAGSGLGFGLGSSLTTSESASAAAVGTGFLPARGWTVVQSGTAGASGTARAIAANVPLDPADGNGLPLATLESLPERGVVVVATFTTRGDPGADFAYPVRILPLQIGDATRAPDRAVLARHPQAEYRLRAGIKGTNVDARIFFGVAQPSAERRTVAQNQLNRLVVASERVTIFARPTIAGNTGIDLFGSVDNGRAGETVTIQAKDCGSQFFRAVAGTETVAGGGWSTRFYPGISTTLRAVWENAASAQITIQQRAGVGLSKRRLGKEYFVSAGGRKSFWRKRVSIQRREGGRWTAVKTVVLTDSYATKGYYSGSGAGAEFTLSVPKGSLIRAVLPLSQAKPCYLAGVSQTVRT